MDVTCPCCGDARFERLLRFEGVPISGRFTLTRSEPVRGVDLFFECCAACGLVRQNPVVSRPDYSQVDRPTSQQLPTYTNALIDRLQTLGVAGGDLVIEVGCNDGSFLERLLQQGFGNLVGVEPSAALARCTWDKGFRVVPDYFDAGLSRQLLKEHGAPSAVLCRHTLEHVPDPRAFVKGLRELCSPRGALLLLEVPDGNAIPERMNIYELWDEHLYCFSADNLGHLLKWAGFSVFDTVTEPHLDTRNLLTWSRPAAALSGGAGADGPWSRASPWSGFAERFRAYRDTVGSSIREGPRPLYFVGAAHSQSNFANYMELGDRVDFMVDDDSAKAGRFVPLRGGIAPVIATRTFLSDARAGTVVLTGFGYPSWMQRIREHAERAGMTIIDPQYQERT